MKFMLRTILVALLCSAFFVPTWAGAQTKEDAMTQLNAAVALFKKVGPAQAIKDINTEPQWRVKGINVVVDDAKGVIHANALLPKLVGKQTYEAKDPSGKPFVKEAIDLAMSPKGEGSVEFQFINPDTKKIEERVMFVKRPPGWEGFVGVVIPKP